MPEHQHHPTGPVGAGFLRHAQHPQNQQALADDSGKATEVGVCGDSVDVQIKVDDDRIADIRVVPHGCLYTVVCASALSELAKGRSLEDALQLSPEDVEEELGGLPEDHKHCARLVVNTLGEAIADHYRRASQREKQPAQEGAAS